MNDSDLDALLATVLDRPVADRAAFLDGACGPDTAGRAAIDRLLRELDDDTPFLRPGGALTGAFGLDLLSRLDRDDSNAIGTMAGPYRIVGELGRGGMAVVYRADRADGAFVQRVALKLIKRGADTDDVTARFRQERQILASLTDPRIARLLDGGVTDAGQPYFAMELVEGEPIDRFCAREQLGVAARVDLCIEVSRAVEHAHQHLVVHRDLKPSNILITQDGSVKLLDFGIAKLLEASGDDAAPATRTALRLMTPEYASPEQVRGGPISTASDIYQLGLVLYELLTGSRAQPIRDLSVAEAERAVCERQPARPSAVVGPSTPAGRQLRGDLDTIVAKALEKEPGRRYRSAEPFVADLIAYREGRPITARKSSVAYRSAKFLRRHTLAASVSTAAVLVIAGTVTVFTVRLAAERDRARREAATANRLTEFVTGLFRGVDPLQAQGANVTARDLLKRGVDRIDATLAGEPEARERVLHEMARLYQQIGLPAEALPLFERSLASRRQRLGAAHTEVAAALHGLAELLLDMGRYDAARLHAEESLRIRERAFGPMHPDVGRSLVTLGRLAQRAGRQDDSIRLLRRAVAIHEATLGPNDPVLATDLTNLGHALSDAWQLEPARDAFTRVLAIEELNYGRDDFRLAVTLAALANVRRKMGDFDGARAALERQVPLTERVLGPDHPGTAQVVGMLALLLMDQGAHDAARQHFERTIAILERAVGPNHPRLAYPTENLGKVHRAMGNEAEALALFARALAIREAAYGPVHVEVSQTLESEGTLRLEMRDFANAERVLRRALDVTRQTFAPGHARIGRIASALGATLAATGRHAEAEPLLLDALTILRAKYGDAHAETVLTRGRVAALYGAWGRPQEAARHRASEPARAAGSP